MKQQPLFWSTTVGLFLLANSLLCLLTRPAFGQLIPDDTLGTERSQVTPNVIIRGEQGDRINGGALRGVNLFHSFTEFNVGNGQRVYFANPTGISNILTRVTGTNPSNILGKLGVDGTANLFLINPNGILFGPNASLDIRGSFTASTANSFTFPNGSEFSAVNPQAVPLLTLNIQPGLQYGRGQSPITNEGQLNVGLGQTLSLLGSVVTNYGLLEAPAGKVQLLGDRVSLLGNAYIDVSSPTGGGTVLIGGDFQGQGAVPTANQVYVESPVTINADATIAGDGGRVIIWSDQRTHFDGTVTAKGGSSIGNGGFVEISGQHTLEYNGLVDTRAAKGAIGTLLLDPTNMEVVALLNSNSLNLADVNQFNDPNQGAGITRIWAGSINAALTNVILQATDTITFNENVNILIAGVGLTAQAGNNIIVNNPIQTNQGAIRLIANDPSSSSPSGTGSIFINANVFSNGAVIDLQAGGNIAVNNAVVASGGANMNLQAGGDIIASNEAGIGTGSTPGFFGDMTIAAGGKFSLRDGSVAITGTIGPGNAGDLNVQAGSVELIGVRSNGIAGGLFTWASGATGNAGNVTVETGQLTVRDGAYIFTGTKGAGNAGNIDIRADTVEVSGVNKIDGRESTISSQSDDASATGASGRITIDANQITVSDRASIASSTSGIGNAGELNLKVGSLIVEKEGFITSGNYNQAIGASGRLIVDANQIIVRDQGTLFSGALGFGNGADMTLKTNTLTLQNNSKVSTEALNQAGNLSIQANDLNLQNNSQIITNSAIQAAGNVVLQIQNNLHVLDDSSIQANTLLGTGGSLLISAKNLTVVNSSTIGSRSPIESTGSITIYTGETAVLSNDSIVAVNSLGNHSNNNLFLETGQLTVADDSAISSLAIGTSTLGSDSSHLTIRANDSIMIRNGSTVSAEAISGNSSNVLVEAGNLTVQNASSIGTTATQGNAGSLTIRAKDEIALSNVGILSTSATLGNGGDLFIQTGQLGMQELSSINSLTVGTGIAGNIAIHAQDAIALNQSHISADSIGTGSGGNIFLGTNRLTVQGANGVGGISSTTLGAGNAGNIIVQAQDSIMLSGRSLGLSATALGNGSGGTITVGTRQLTVQDGSGIATVAFDPSTVDSSVLNQLDPALMALLQTGFPSNSVGDSSAGAAGDIRIQATDTIQVLHGGLITTAGAGRGVVGGDISLTTTQLDIEQAAVAAGTIGFGTAGDIQVSARNIFLNNQGQLTATSTSGNGGNITLTVQDLLLMRYNSLISATAGTAGGGGDGGNITIDARNGFIVAVLGENSDIRANAFEGRGGNIRITTQGIFGLQFRKENTPLSDITVSSRFGLDGVVEITTLGIDPSRGLAPSPELPQAPRITSDCPTVGQGEGGHFTASGRGGLPLNAIAALSSQTLWQDDRSTTATDSTITSSTESGEEIVEANTWIRLPDGSIVLTINSTSPATSIPQVSHPASTRCYNLMTTR